MDPTGGEITFIRSTKSNIPNESLEYINTNYHHLLKLLHNIVQNWRFLRKKKNR